MLKRLIHVIAGVMYALLALSAYGWDHPGHMTTAAIAFYDIKQARPELIEKLQLLFLVHPDTAPFWVAAGEAKGEERTRRRFIECARWPDIE